MEAVNGGVFARVLQDSKHAQVLQNSDVREVANTVRLYQNAIEAKPDYAQPYYQLGVIYELSGGNARALHFYEQAYGLSNQNFMAAFKLANSYVSQGRPREAVEFYERAVTINPYNHDWRESVVAELTRFIRTNKHAQIYKEALGKFDTSPRN